MRKRRQLFQKLLASILSLALVLTGAVPQGISSVQAAGEAEDGLILYYDFDLQNSFATEISDASGNGNAGQLKRIGGAPEGNYSIDEVSIYGKQVKALNLPGGEDGTYLQLPNGILKDSDAVTISMWVKLTTDTGYQRIWDFGSNTTSYMYLLSDGGNTGFEGYASAITKEGWSKEKGVSKGVDSNIDKNRWVLTTVVMDGSNMSLYENGRQIKETVDTGITVKDLGNTIQNYIAYGQFGDAPTKGQFAEVKIYNKALTAAEIESMYYVTDAGIVTADDGDLDLGDTSAVTEDIELPTKGINGSDIAWTSQNTAIEIQTAEDKTIGKVTRPDKGAENAVGTLTATISKGTAETTKTFDVTVVAQYTDQQRADKDAAELRKSMGDLSAVTADITLPATGSLGSVVQWASANPAIKIENGVAKVTRPAIGEANASGKLTATVSYGEAEAKVELETTVLAFREVVTIDTVEDVNVTTLKGKSPSLPNYVRVTYSDDSAGKEKVTWPSRIDKEKYAAAGAFTVEGSIIDARPAKKVTANVTVIDEEEAIATVVSDTFDLSDITLDKIGENGSILTQNRDRDIDYLKLLDNKRMLYNFYKTFGQTAKIEGVSSLGGWDEPSGLLRGHSTGHYMSALALAYASTGDEEINNKLKEMIHELRELQKMSQGDAKAFTSAGVDQSLWSTDPTEWGEGFISAYSPDQFSLLERYTPYAQIWAPYYTLHKLIAGFLDAYTYTGNEEALEAAKALGKWTYNRLTGCTQEQLEKMWDMYIAGEFGGFNESMAQLYIYAKADNDADAEIYLKGAKLFDNKIFFDSLAANVDGKLLDENGNETDKLAGIQRRHANQHIPQIIGAMEIYEATVAKGSPEMYYFDVAENFWQMVVSRYAYSTGGVGTGEKFMDPYQQANNISGNENCETCAAYNLLKLTRMLNNYNPDNAEYMDYYERTLYNQILASQTPNVTASMHNGTTYMLPIGPGATRSYGDDYNSFTCCHGTGMENHVKYQEAAYAKTADTLYVGLYMPTTLTWEEKGVKVVQETAFPSETTKLTVSAMEGKTAANFDMKLRVPYWATNGFDVKKNGVKVNVDAQISAYATLEDIQAGDVIEIEMPWTLHLDKTPDKIGTSTVASVMYGPFVMAAKNSSKDWITLKLSANLSDSIKTGTNTANGFPTLSANGYEFAPMFAPEYATSAYHAYFKVYTISDDGKYYDVTVDNYTPEKGSFSVDEVVKEGSDLVITAHPGDGYAVQMLVVNGQKVQIGADNTYTVQNVSGDVAIVGSFCSANPPAVYAQNMEFAASVTTDYTAGWEDVNGIKKDWEPAKSNDGSGKGWGNWSQEPGSEHYVQYMWDSEVTMNRFDIFWYDDGGGTRIPASLKIMYIAEDGTWREANMTSNFEDIVAIDQYNTIYFDEITTVAVKLVMTVHPQGAANGIYRWKVINDLPATTEDKTELKTALDDIKNLAAAENESRFTPETWSKLQEALAKVQETYGNESATKADIGAAMMAAHKAIAGLQLVNPPSEEDKVALKAAIDAAAAKDKSKYTEDSWKNLQTALDKAKKVYDNIIATKVEVTEATTALNEAVRNLKELSNGGNSNGNESNITKPGTPTSVKAVWTGTANIKITWKKAANAEKYHVYRSYKKSSGFKKIATVAKTSYVDKKSTAGKTAYYKIVATKGTVSSSYSQTVSVYKLKAPVKLKAKAKKRNVTISYGKVANAKGYEIFRSTKKKGKYKKVATIKKAKTTKKTFKNMKKGTYYFKVRAYKTSGKKKIYTGYSKTVSVKVK